MKTIGWILLALLILVLVLVLTALVRTLLKPQKHSDWEPPRDPEREDRYARKLSRMVQYETISRPDDVQREKFLGFHKVLEAEFPLLHQHLEKKEIDGSLLYHWKGRHADKPIVLMGHQDVVPAEGEWLHAPFSGDIADDKIWGRGSADTKCTILGFMQAIEELLAEGFVPEQDVYLSSSNTEEVSGEGCPKLVAELKSRGVRPYLVCDEGGAIVVEPIAGIKGSYAMLGVLEKGWGNLKVTARSAGGHSSYPPKNSPIARLSKFVVEIEKKDPMRVEFEPEVRDMFTILADYAPFGYRLLFGNLWLFRPLLKKLMPKLSAQAAALLRTTVAFTQSSGSEGANVLPSEATLTLNLRYIPHQGMEESNAVIRKIAAKYDLEVEEVAVRDYCAPVRRDTPAFHLVEDVIATCFPGLPAVPYVMTGGTDARFYQEICDVCVRFEPVIFGPAQMKGMHGLNEYLDTCSLPLAVDFYKTLIQKL